MRLNIEDLYEHPNDRGVLTQSQVMSLANDWRRAGEPMEEDFGKWLADHWFWGRVPTYFFLNTIAYMEKHLT